MSDFIVGIHALVYLGHKGIPLNSEALADNICTHPARVRKTMSALKKAKLVETREGQGGGYKISKPLNEMTLWEVAKSLHSPILETRWYSGDEENQCMICSGMAKVTDEIYEMLNESLKHKLSQIRLSDIEHRLMEVGKHEGKIRGERK